MCMPCLTYAPLPTEACGTVNGIDDVCGPSILGSETTCKRTLTAAACCSDNQIATVSAPTTDSDGKPYATTTCACKADTYPVHGDCKRKCSAHRSLSPPAGAALVNSMCSSATKQLFSLVAAAVHCTVATSYIVCANECATLFLTA
jgi:hypothetical protein